MKLPDDLDGVFSGWDEQKKKYSADTLAVQRRTEEKDAMQARTCRARAVVTAKIVAARPATCASTKPIPPSSTLVVSFNVLKRHFARYTPELVEDVCGVPQKLISQSCRDLLERIRSGENRARSAMPSVGRSIPMACRSSAPRPSFNFCWATSDARAAAFWRCAAMPAFKAQPIFRLSTTFCPAIFRCRFGKVTADTLQRFHQATQSQARMVEQFRQIHRQPAEGLVWRAGHRRK